MSGYRNNPDGRIHKWKGDLRVSVTGAFTAADLALVDTVCAQLTTAIGGPVRVVLDTSGTQNVVIRFYRPHELINNIGPEYNIGAVGAPSLDALGYADSGSVELDGSYVGGARGHAIRHELMHVLGFYDHSHLVQGSILSDEYSTNPEFLDVDRGAIEMLYRDEIQVGMNGLEAVGTLRGLQRRH